MTYGEFVASADNRRRYWARSFVGWRRFAAAAPNDGHRAVAALQRLGLVREVITQNVDGLHQAAGARDVLELHGNLDRVVCLNCGESAGRADLDTRLREANPGFEVVAGEIRPDGDVVLPEEAVQGFHPPRCLVCASDLVKPDVVFFGESVPKPLVEQCFGVVERSRGLLVLGLLAAGDVRLPVRAPRRRAVPAGRDRHPRGDPRRRPGDDPPGRAAGSHPDPTWSPSSTPRRSDQRAATAAAGPRTGRSAGRTPRRRTASDPARTRHLAEDRGVVAVDGGVGLVVRHQPHVAVLALERLDRRLVVQQRRDDVAVVGRRLLRARPPSRRRRSPRRPWSRRRP